MKAFDAYTDDAGVRWEVYYNQRYDYERNEAGNIVSADSVGTPIPVTVIEELRFRSGPDDPPWQSLPPWATVREDAMITLGWFDEDDDTGDLTFWDVVT